MATVNHIKIFQSPLKKRNGPLKMYYIKTIWKVDSLKDLSGLDDMIICELIVTDCASFWTRTATYAALSGLKLFENQNISCRIDRIADDAELSWNLLMDQPEIMPLQLTLGTVSLDPVSQIETLKMWQEWMDYFIEERNQIMINDLAQEKIELMTSDKTDNQKMIDKVELSSEPLELQFSDHSETNKQRVTLEKSPLPRSKLSPTNIVLPSKRPRLDKIIESNEGASTSKEPGNQGDQGEDKDKKPQLESVLTKTFRGQVIKSRKINLNRVTLDDILTNSEQVTKDPSKKIDKTDDLTRK
ncbi:10029_t:CDS:2 [Funneliformis geosporum]|uniref:16235_t:CDS:1 n=1 Tax=Funneliformis geosporum TaxID=1117311 RepID=A0A9W4SGK0_9GLOM|nr:10029_t:CDS:2 [Funneliformis geosporum]CAI2167561.1 16235_t:CDS:2 [Funneliformis geosporum]